MSGPPLTHHPLCNVKLSLVNPLHGCTCELAERLEAALKEAREERDKAIDAWDKASDEREELRASLASFTEGARQIAQFAQHKVDCAIEHWIDVGSVFQQPKPTCTCGLAEAILALGTKTDPSQPL